jgi:acetyl esterase/lipase
MLLGPSPSPAMERAHSPAHNVTAATPPCFLAHAEDDRTVSVENTVEMRAALKAAGVKVETHLFAAGDHGFGLAGPAGEPARRWKEIFVGWSRAQGLG